MEGHTDKRPISKNMVGRNPDVFRPCNNRGEQNAVSCQEANNLLLGSMRGATVYSEIHSALGANSKPHVSNWYRDKAIVSGRGQMEPFVTRCGGVLGSGDQLDRRVEIVFNLVSNFKKKSKQEAK